MYLRFFPGYFIAVWPGVDLGGILGTFWFGTKAFKETGPEMEIPGRDLDVGTNNK